MREIELNAEVMSRIGSIADYHRKIFKQEGLSMQLDSKLTELLWVKPNVIIQEIWKS